MRSKHPSSARMQVAVDLYRLIKKQAMELDEADFVRRHRGWYYLSLMPESQPDQIPFVTKVNFIPVSSTGPTGPLPEAQVAADWLWKVEKTSDNAWKRRISVGRANNNDIVIRHESVSKLHAHFHAEPTDPDDPQAPERFQLADAESSNGTFINAKVLSPQATETVSNRDRITFGAVVGVFLDAGSLHSELNAREWF